MLTTDLEVPVVAETTVGTRRHNAFPMQNLPHLLQTVEILTKRGLEVVRDFCLYFPVSTSFCLLRNH